MQDSVMTEYDELIEKLNAYAYQYYVLDNPTVSDKEYDVLYDRLVTLERSTGVVSPASPSRKVGGEPVKSFGSHEHLARLYSLDKAQSAEELTDWYRRVTASLGFAPALTLEHKLDGLTVCVTYDKGHFVRATTRGNGVTGEDVTQQVLTVKSLPLTISAQEKLEIQGEGVMRLSKFNEYNRTAQEPLKNARNGVAGAIRNLDPKVTAKRNLDIYFYNVNYSDGRLPLTQAEMFDFLRVEKFLTAPYQRFEDMNGILKAIERVDRHEFDYLIDGMVVKVDELEYRARLGYTDKFPRWAIAYKFTAEETSTVLEEVEWNVGRTGKVTPLAHLSPVELCGATVTRATLNNLTDIHRKDLSIGDRVFVRRSNDVIPEITGLAERGNASSTIDAPERCPGCGGALTENGAHLYCLNPDCPPQIAATLVYFCSKECMDVAGISDSTAAQLYDVLHVTTPVELYALTKEDLLRLEGVKDKKAENILNGLAASKTVTLAKYIMALGISGVGKTTAKDLASAFGSKDALKNATLEQLTGVNEVGETIAANVIEYFELYGDYADKLASVLSIVSEKTGLLNGKKFVLTGTLPTLTRGEATKLIEEEGGTVGSSVTKDTDYLVLGADAGSKSEKAKKLGTTILDEKDLLQLLQKV